MLSKKLSISMMPTSMRTQDGTKDDSDEWLSAASPSTATKMRSTKRHTATKQLVE
jgi:hypothetical protein